MVTEQSFQNIRMHAKQLLLNLQRFNTKRSSKLRKPNFEKVKILTTLLLIEHYSFSTIQSMKSLRSTERWLAYEDKCATLNLQHLQQGELLLNTDVHSAGVSMGHRLLVSGLRTASLRFLFIKVKSAVFLMSRNPNVLPRHDLLRRRTQTFTVD